MLPKNIIIVEDEVITQRYLKDILTYYNIKIAECFDNGDDILLSLKALKPNMILMDINIKGSMDGIELAREIISKYQIPIIFITAYSDEETLKNVLELSPYGFITKPFKSQDLYITLKVAYKQFITHKAELSKIQNSDIIINKEFRFSKNSDKLYYNNETLKLSPKQHRLIRLLAKNLNTTVSVEQIMEEVWKNEKFANSSLRTLIYSIRKQFPTFPLKSDSKRGYYLSTNGFT